MSQFRFFITSLSLAVGALAWVRKPVELRRSRIKRKRSKPRRGRVTDLAYLAWMATLPCFITGEFPATTHHVRFCGSPKDDHRTIRLVARLHMLTHDLWRRHREHD